MSLPTVHNVMRDIGFTLPLTHFLGEGAKEPEIKEVCHDQAAVLDGDWTLGAADRKCRGSGRVGG
jgi:hypothetical protein